jgi:transposase
MRCPNCKQRTMYRVPDGDYWCDNCGSINHADVQLAHFERDNYVWFDENDHPNQAEGWAGFYSNAVQLDAQEA